MEEPVVLSPRPVKALKMQSEGRCVENQTHALPSSSGSAPSLTQRSQETRGRALPASGTTSQPGNSEPLRPLCLTPLPASTTTWLIPESFCLPNGYSSHHASSFPLPIPDMSVHTCKCLPSLRKRPSEGHSAGCLQFVDPRLEHSGKKLALVPGTPTLGNTQKTDPESLLLG